LEDGQNTNPGIGQRGPCAFDDSHTNTKLDCRTSGRPPAHVAVVARLLPFLSRAAPLHASRSTTLLPATSPALRKKQNRIAQMEESAAAGKALNQEQKEVLRSKPIVAALIDELDRLRAPLSAALTEELSTVPAPAAPAPAPAADSSVQDLLALVYFGSLFDVKPQSEFLATMVAREHEQGIRWR
jgi:hypothetical protein